MFLGDQPQYATSGAVNYRLGDRGDTIKCFTGNFFPVSAGSLHWSPGTSNRRTRDPVSAQCSSLVDLVFYNHRFTEKAPTRAFSLFKAPTS